MAIRPLFEPLKPKPIACQKCYGSGLVLISDPVGNCMEDWVRVTVPCECPEGSILRPAFYSAMLFLDALCACGNQAASVSPQSPKSRPILVCAPCNRGLLRRHHVKPTNRNLPA